MKTPRLTIHSRLVLSFGAILVISGILMVAVIYLAIRYLPSYQFANAHPGPMPSSSADPVVQGYSRTVNVSSAEDVWGLVLTVSIAALAMVAALGTTAGWFTARRLLAPIRAINAAAIHAGEGDLTRRVGATGPPDELRELADTFDVMLARLEESFAAHRRFAANASHELLTPLATTRTALQIAMDDTEHLAELAPILYEANERNIDVVNSLLQLARAEHPLPDAEPVNLGAIVTEVVTELADQAATRDVTVYVDDVTSVELPGNAVLLRGLVVNLLQNALAYNVPDGSVDIAVYTDEGAHLEITNTGPVVEADLVERLFEPFYRRESRVGSGDRHGLGLAIARAIVHGHHGEITASANQDGGLTIRVTLPVSG